MIKNRWIRKTSILLSIIIGILFILSYYITYFLNNRLPKIIAEKNDTAYNLNYEDLNFSLFNSSLSLKNVEVSPKDSALINDSIKVTGKVNEINIVGINFIKLIVQKEVSAYSININQPIVNYYLKDQKDSIKKKDHEIKVGDRFNVSNLNINDAEFNLYSPSGERHLANVSNFDINFEGVRFNEKTVNKKIPFRYSNFEIKLDSMFFVIKDKQIIRAKKVRLNTETFELEKFTMKPLKINGQYYIPNDTEADLLDIESPYLSLTKMDWGFTSEDKLFFETDLIQFKKPKITIITAKPANKAETKKLELKTDNADLINIKKFQIENGKIKALFSNAKTVKYAVNNVDLSIEGIKMNELTRTNEIPIDYKTFRLKLDSMYYRLNEMHTLTASNFDLTERKVVLKNFKMKPFISKNQFNNQFTKSNTLLDVEAPILTLNNNSWGMKNGEFYFHTNSIKLDKVDVKIIDQKNKNTITKKENKNKFLINFNLAIDTIQVKHSHFLADKKFDFNNVDLTVLGLVNVYGKKLYAKNLILKNPKFTIHQEAEQKKKSIQKSKSNFNDFIEVNTIRLENGHLAMIPFQEKEPNLTLKNIDFNLHNLKINPTTLTQNIPFHYESIDLKSSGLDADLGKVYQLNTSDFYYKNGNFVLNKLKFVPKVTRKQYTASLKKQADLFDVTVNKISVGDIKWGFLPNKKLFFKSNLVKLYEADATIYRSLVPPNDLSKKTLFSEKLRNLKMGLEVKQLVLVNSKLAYEEETEKSVGAGKLSFTKINTTVYNVNSGYQKKKLPNVIVDWYSEFMTGDLQTKWTFNPMNTSEKFNIKGSITNLPAKNMDPFLKPYLKVSAEGNLNKVMFNFNGNDIDASGDFGIHYNDLKVNVLREDGTKRKFLSAIGNAAVKKDSKGEVKNEKVENVERKQDKSFFNFFLACILDGLKKALLII